MPKPIITSSSDSVKALTPDQKLVTNPRFREAFERHRGDPTTGAHSKPIRDSQSDFRSLARFWEFIGNDSPQRRALLKAAGLSDDAISKWMCEIYSDGLYRDIESDEFSSWAKHGDRWNEQRDGKPLCNGLNTHRLSSVVPRDLEWAWPQRIPRGKLTLLSGDPNLGKTWVMLDVIARITTGRDFPDASNPFFKRQDVLWVSGEDDDNDTILPRLRMLDGDPSRVHSLTTVLDNKKECTLNLSSHLVQLDDWLFAHPGVLLVAIDPFAAFLGKIDSHRNSDVRGLLTPLSKLASRHRVAIVGINHLSKGDGENAMYRGMGSIAFVAAARSSWMVSKDPSGPPDRRLFTNVKNNLASEDVGGLAFRIGPNHGGISWEEGRIDTTADDSLKPNSTGAPARDEAKEWLRELLKDGPVLASDVWERARADRMCEKTMKFAKKELGVRTDKTGGPGTPWEWSLPRK